MKFLSSFFFFCLINICISFSQSPSIQWQHCFGGTGSEGSFDIIETSDAGYISVGTTDSNDGDVAGGHGNQDIWVIKILASGSLEWQKCFGGSGSEGPAAIVKNYDGSYLIAGGTSSIDGNISPNHGYFDGWLIKIDSAGNLLWQKCYGGLGYDSFSSLIQTSDSGVLVSGVTYSNDGDVSGLHNPGGNEGDIWVVKLDSSGNIEWQKCLGGSDHDGGYVTLIESDNKYVIASATKSNDGDVTTSPVGDFDFWIVCLDDSGNKLWDKTYGGSQRDVISGICKQIGETGFVISGTTVSNNGTVSGNHSNSGFNDYWVVSLDSIGDFQWQKCFGGSYDEIENSPIRPTLNGYIMAGSANSNDGDVTNIHSPGSFVEDFWLVQLDTTGNIEWEKCLGGNDGDLAFSIKQTSDSGYIVSGYGWSTDGDLAGSGNHGNGDAWIVKLSPLNTASSEISKNYLTDFNVFCKNDLLNISFYSDKSSEVLIDLVDMTGKTLLNKNISTTQGFNSWKCPENFDQGMYFVRLTSDKGCDTKKFIKN